MPVPRSFFALRAAVLHRQAEEPISINLLVPAHVVLVVRYFCRIRGTHWAWGQPGGNTANGLGLRQVIFDLGLD